MKNFLRNLTAFGTALAIGVAPVVAIAQTQTAQAPAEESKSVAEPAVKDSNAKKAPAPASWEPAANKPNKPKTNS